MMLVNQLRLMQRTLQLIKNEESKIGCSIRRSAILSASTALSLQKSTESQGKVLAFIIFSLKTRNLLKLINRLDAFELLKNFIRIF